jgi:hypothetical protein
MREYQSCPDERKSLYHKSIVEAIKKNDSSYFLGKVYLLLDENEVELRGLVTEMYVKAADIKNRADKYTADEVGEIMDKRRRKYNYEIQNTKTRYLHLVEPLNTSVNTEYIMRQNCLTMAKNHWDAPLQIQTALAKELGEEYFPQVEIQKLVDLDVLAYCRHTAGKDIWATPAAEIDLKYQRIEAMKLKYGNEENLLGRILERHGIIGLDKIEAAGISIDQHKLPESGVKALAEIRASMARNEFEGYWGRDKLRVDMPWTDYEETIDRFIRRICNKKEINITATKAALQPFLSDLKSRYEESVNKKETLKQALG